MQETTASSALPPGASVDVKCPTRIITYGWGERYVDVLLTFTLPALLAPGNLPYVASEVPCELVILTQRRYFSKFDRHPTVARIRQFCPVRLVRLDDLIVSKDKYGMTLTYALHRAFSDLGPAMTEHWQIFLNADFILADGSLRTVIGHLARGERIVASPSYCTVAESVVPELRKHLDPTTSTLSISHRELARLILQHCHTVIRGKIVNQTNFHMRYTDQFYWSIDESALLGYQMPVSIIGLRPERYVEEPNSYWDFGLIWEYCPDAEVCVIGDSDEFTMLELRDRSVAEDQIVPGPPDKKAIADLMVTWVTPYQQHFLKFPLTLHDCDLLPNVEDVRDKLRTFVYEVMSNAPSLPSHIAHSQWEYHYTQFHQERQISSRIRSWVRKRCELAVRSAAWVARLYRETTRQAEQKVIELCTPVARNVGDKYVRRVLRRYRLELVKNSTLLDIQRRVQECNAEITQLKQQEAADHICIADLREKIADLREKIAGLREKIAHLTEEATNISDMVSEYQLNLKRSYDYQMAITRGQVRLGTSNLEADFLAEYERCRQYSTTSWDNLCALHKISAAGYQHAIASGVYLKGVDTSRIGVRLPVAREELEDPSVFLIIGQSNGANHGETRSAASGAVFNFNPFDGLCYRACDPLLGATGDGGSPWCILGDALIGDGFAQSILLCPLAIGGSTVAEWAPGGTYQHRMTYGISALRQAGFEPSYVLWHQGEADALYGTTADEYIKAFRAFVKSLRDLDVQAPIYVALASYFTVPEGHEAGQAIIRRAQQSLISPQQAIFPGPDTDRIRDRIDGSHMGTAGLREHAQLWQVALLEGRCERGSTLQGLR